MSICQSYRLLSKDEFQKFLANPDWAEKFLYGNFFNEDFEESEEYDDSCFPEEELAKQGKYVDIQKEWQALHFLLTGKIEFHQTAKILPLLDSVIMGGHDTPYEATYGYYRYFTSEETQQIADMLANIEAIALKELHKDKFSQATNLYANQSPDKWNEEYWGYILDYFDDVKELFIKAARENYIVLVSSD
ncbi:MAG: YfbM family protein [Acidobacteriota bacterium]